MSAPISIGIFIVLLSIAAFVLERSAKRARDRSAQQCCLRCGYDLRASRDRCPECGERPFRLLDRKKLRKFSGTSTEFAAASDDERTAIIHQTTEKQEARLLVLQLELRHIPARWEDAELKGQPFLSLFKVCVRENQKSDAENVLREFERPLAEG